jgi:hypothetical protein
MLPLRQSTVRNAPTIDRFRGTTQRWTIETGPLAGTTYDHTFHLDWSVSWRAVTGESQGRCGRARQFRVEPVRADIYLLCYPLAPGQMVVATLDFTHQRLVGVQSGIEYCHPLSGSFRAL